ncbi:MAG: ester cyclase, partial [Boseongicola sp.]|nr:ester cyclase [Boseongicola sp.]
HPFNAQTGVEAVAETFWKPFLTAFSRVQRRQDIFFAGRNETDGLKGVWVVSMGHLMGLFDAPWLGIRPTRKIAMLRYAEFNRVKNGQIIETAFFCDIPHLMTQAGQSPFPPATAQHLVQPGPISHNGLLFEDAPEAEGKATLAVINAMISDLGTWDLGVPIEEELARTWHVDMIWWGPEGIGATYTIERYAKQHAGPFRAAFKERSKTGHLARLAEGHFGGFFGWPNFQAVHEGGLMGMPSSQGQKTEFRVVDIYLRRDDKLAENWIFIDMLHWLKSQGIDVLERLAKQQA